MRLGLAGIKEHVWFTDYKIVEEAIAANEKWTWQDVFGMKVKVPLTRPNILKSPAIVALMDARFAKERKVREWEPRSEATS